MNCKTDLEFEFTDQFGLIKKVELLSIIGDNCLLKSKENKYIRTSKYGVKIISKPHVQMKSIDEINFDECLILVTELFMCNVKVVKVVSEDNDSKSGNIENILVEVVSYDNGLLFHEKETICAPLSDLYHVGEYKSIGDMKEIELEVPIEYSRYFLNPAVYQTLQKQFPNSILVWEAHDLKLKLLFSSDAEEEEIKEDFESLGLIFVAHLPLLFNQNFRVSSFNPSDTRILNKLEEFLYWEYQYTSEDEANFAIGPNGICITSVRMMEGIVAVVLNKYNRLRIIAENKEVIESARCLLEIENDDYFFEDSLIPLLIGKLASHIKEVISKTDLHCIFIPNQCFDGKLNDVVQVANLFIRHPVSNRSRTNSTNSSVNESSVVTSEVQNGNEDTLNLDTDTSDKVKPVPRRRLILYGRKEAIQSCKMLLEIEESVKELKLEFEQKRSMKPNTGTVSNSILMSSNLSSVSSLSRPENITSSVPVSNNAGDNTDQIIEDSSTPAKQPDDYEFENLQPPSPILWTDSPTDQEAPVDISNVVSEASKDNDRHSQQIHESAINFLEFFSSNRQPPAEITFIMSDGTTLVNSFDGSTKSKHRNRKRSSQKQSPSPDNHSGDLLNNQKSTSNTFNKHRQNSFKNYEHNFHNRSNSNNNNINMNGNRNNRNNNNKNKGKFYINPGKINDNNNNHVHSIEYPDHY